MEKFAAGITLVLLATTLVLPGRITPQVAEKVFGGSAKLATAVIGQGK